MQAVQTLPPNYRPAKSFDLKSTPRLLALNVLGLVMLFISIWLFSNFVIWVRPADAVLNLEFAITSSKQILYNVGGLLLLSLLMVVLHEGLHGLSFWYFTRQMPRFAFKGAYAYAAAPGWYIPRNAYLITGLAPLVGITLIGLLVLAFAPAGLILPTLALMCFNASGAGGDLWVVVNLLRVPVASYALDDGDSAVLFVPEF